MATLISYQSSDGSRGRCDARCYNAKHPRCKCICGGVNHGVGLRQAVLNTATMAEEWLEKYEDGQINRELVSDFTKTWEQMKLL